MKGRRQRGEDKGEKEKGEERKRGQEGEKKEMKGGEVRKLRANDHIRSNQIQWLTQLPFVVC